MNILKKIEDKTYQNEDLINNIDLNPVVSYHIIKEIVNSKINDINVIHKLIEISVKLSVNDSVLGPICLGHMSLAALRKLGVDERIVDNHSAISDYDWELVDKFYHESGWWGRSYINGIERGKNNAVKARISEVTIKNRGVKSESVGFIYRGKTISILTRRTYYLFRGRSLLHC